MPQTNITVRISGGDIFLEDPWWPGRLYIDPDFLKVIECGEYAAAKIDGENIRFGLANGWAVYRPLGPAARHRAYVFECISCARDLDA